MRLARRREEKEEGRSRLERGEKGKDGRVLKEERRLEEGRREEGYGWVEVASTSSLREEGPQSLLVPKCPQSLMALKCNTIYAIFCNL